MEVVTRANNDSVSLIVVGVSVATAVDRVVAPLTVDISFSATTVVVFVTDVVEAGPRVCTTIAVEPVTSVDTAIAVFTAVLESTDCIAEICNLKVIVCALNTDVVFITSTGVEKIDIVTSTVVLGPTVANGFDETGSATMDPSTAEFVLRSSIGVGEMEEDFPIDVSWLGDNIAERSTTAVAEIEVGDLEDSPGVAIVFWCVADVADTVAVSVTSGVFSTVDTFGFP